jgi:hypothetical protein
MRDIAEYESLLAKNFEFVLSREDQQKPDLPDSWGREIEVQLHRRMLDAEYVQTLTLEFTVGDLEWDPAFGMLTLLARRVSVYIYGSTPGHPTEVSVNQVRDSCSRLWFVRNRWTTGSRQDSVWTIVRWEDQPVADSCSVAGSFSWGALKAGAW